jgi:sec-independent protein translocase protein TatA
MFSQIGATEILIILGIVVLLFGAKKLPELARGSGEALRIFKSEVKGDDKPEELEAQALEASADPAEKKPEQQA